MTHDQAGAQLIQACAVTGLGEVTQLVSMGHLSYQEVHCLKLYPTDWDALMHPGLSEITASTTVYYVSMIV